MFGTLHWDSRRKETEFVKQSHATSHRERNSACDRCRLHKVKCRVNNDVCSRCTRFRKACTFTSAKQHFGLGAGKGENPRTPHEQQLDFGLRSPDPASEKQHSPENQPSPAVSKDITYDSDHGQEQELLPELTGEPPSSFFDVSPFLDTPSNQDGSFSFFPPSETLLSPPASLGNEPTHISTLQDVAVSSVDNASLPTLTIPPTSPPRECRCLAAAALAVEEFQTSCNHGNRAELDSIISHQKKAVKCCRSMISCTSCTRNRENIVLLIFITEKVVAACSQVVLLYSTGDSALETQAPLGLSTEMTSVRDSDFQLKFWGLDTHGSSSASKSIWSPFTSTLPSWRELLVGDYEVSSQLEWEHLMRALISIQLRAVMDLLANTRRLKSDILTEVQATSLARSQNSIAKLGNQMSAMY